MTIELTAAQITALYAMRKTCPTLLVGQGPIADGSIFVRASRGQRGSGGLQVHDRIWRIDGKGVSQRVTISVEAAPAETREPAPERVPLGDFGLAYADPPPVGPTGRYTIELP